MLEINNLFFPYELKILGVMVTNKTPLLEITFLSMMTIASFFKDRFSKRNGAN